MKTYKHNLYGTDTEVVVEKSAYRVNNHLAVQLKCRPEIDPDDMEDSGYSKEEAKSFCEVYFTVTVNLPESSQLPEDVQFVDTNNIPDIDDWLIENDIAEPTGVCGRSGFCAYPALRFK